jgi:hypothetical protein
MRPYRQLLKSTEEEQVEEFIKAGVSFASGPWNNCKSRIGNAGVTLKVQKKQLKVNDNVRLKVADKKSEAQLRAREKVQSALSKFEFDSKSMYDKDSGYVIRWVLPQVKVDFLLKDLKKRKDILAKLANPPSNWTTYKPRREALSAATTTTTTATVK